MKQNQKLLSLVLALVMLLSLGTIAFADEPMLIDIAAASDAVFTVYTAAYDGAEPVAAKAYTAEDIAALMEEGEAAYGWQKNKDGVVTINTIVATKYVSLAALLDDAGITFKSGDVINFTCTDGAYKKFAPDYDTITAAKYNYDGDEVAPVLAYAYGDSADTAKDAENPRFLMSLSAAQLEEGTGVFGYCFPSGVVSITVTHNTPVISVYTAEYEGAEPVLAKEYNAGTIAALVEEGAAEYGWKRPKGDTVTINPIVATKYVTLSALLDDAGVSFEKGDVINFTCTDGAYKKFVPSYDVITAAKYNYGGAEVAPVLALTYGETAETAIDAENPRFLLGLSASQLEEGTGVFGYCFPTDVVSITITYVPYPDVASDWYTCAVAYATKAGIVRGDDKGNFNPLGTLDVRSFLQMLYNQAGAPNGLVLNSPDWYVPARDWGIEKGYITADTDVTAPCTRLMVVEMMYAAAGSPEVTTSGTFTDTDAVAVEWAAANNITKGVGGGLFDPTGNLNRAMAVQFLYNCK